MAQQVRHKHENANNSQTPTPSIFLFALSSRPKQPCLSCLLHIANVLPQPPERHLPAAPSV